MPPPQASSSTAVAPFSTAASKQKRARPSGGESELEKERPRRVKSSRGQKRDGVAVPAAGGPDEKGKGKDQGEGTVVYRRAMYARFVQDALSQRLQVRRALFPPLLLHLPVEIDVPCDVVGRQLRLQSNNLAISLPPPFRRFCPFSSTRTGTSKKDLLRPILLHSRLRLLRHFPCSAPSMARRSYSRRFEAGSESRLACRNDSCGSLGDDGGRLRLCLHEVYRRSRQCTDGVAEGRAGEVC
jgi:hypothetical protein